jgi:hypothetical protein
MHVHSHPNTLGIGPTQATDGGRSAHWLWAGCGLSLYGYSVSEVMPPFTAQRIT